MHRLEKVVRKFATLATRSLWSLPKSWAIPLAGVITELPASIARAKNLDALVVYFKPGPTLDNFDYHDCALVIQGPIQSSRMARDLKSTLDLYRELYPGIKLVLSTWDNQPHFPDLISEDIEMVVSEDPGFSYPTNLLRQQVSTLAGLNRAREIGTSFAIKTRVDHRITAPHAINYLRTVSELQTNPKFVGSASYGSGLYRLYGQTEQLQFGSLDNLLDYWSTDPLKSLHPIQSDSIQSELSLSELALAVHECRLNVNYLLKLGFPVQWTWDNHLWALREHFVICDSTELGLVLLGRTRNVRDHVYPWNEVGQNNIEQHLSLADWLIARKGLPFAKVPDRQILRDAMKVPVNEINGALMATLLNTREQ